MRVYKKKLPAGIKKQFETKIGRKVKIVAIKEKKSKDNK